MNGNKPEGKPDSKTQCKEAENKQYLLWLINDDINTFDHVVDALMDCCDHSFEQAYQCSIITHYKGKCDVYRSSLEDVKEKAVLLSERNLSVRIT